MKRPREITKFIASVLILYLGVVVTAHAAAAPPAPIADIDAHCSQNNGNIDLPDGFCAVVVADVGPARHLTVRANGDIYVALSRSTHGGGIAALRDTTGNGQADIVTYFGAYTGTGIAIHAGWLYFAPTGAVLRYQLDKQRLVPKGRPQKIVKDLPAQHEHSARSMAFDGSGHLYVNIGAPSNSCQKRDRTRRSPGQKPCPLLQRHGGIWRFQADQPGQSQAEGQRFATGTRHVIALAWNGQNQQLYGVQMGRDQLHSLWPRKFTVSQSVQLPAEQFYRIDAGDDFGWPYCYYDGKRHQKLLAPEYGGNGKKVGQCRQYPKPILAFPAHWAPESLLFYTGKQFPERYRGGAFVAFHGSWNRSPQPQRGYKVVFVPFNHGKPAGTYKAFATGFKGRQTLHSPRDARYRPVGLAQGPDGSLYIADSQQGRIWRVMYIAGKH